MVHLIGYAARIKEQVVDAGICVGCGACVALSPSEHAQMIRRQEGTVPVFSHNYDLSSLAWEACPGKGVDYPELYRKQFSSFPSDWRVGHVNKLWTGHAADQIVRSMGASGGVTSAVLIYLLESGRIDGAVLAKQGLPSPEEASWFIARNRDDILSCAQSVYIPVPMLTVLPHLREGERYAMTCVPEQSAALRVLQHAGHAQAQQINYVLGPYTGTSLEPGAIRALLRANEVLDDDPVTSLAWRAGDWPGYVEIHTQSGRVVRSKKVYYNFLIPFYITQTSLQSMDFANEFTDLSVGDAWSPQFEAMGQGFSVVASRTKEMTEIIEGMVDKGLLELSETEVLAASAMHGHMIDFKKRGGYLRNQWRIKTGRFAPDYGLRPVPIDGSRIFVEIVISFIFTVCRTRLARGIMERIPGIILGPLFNRLRLLWKGASKPAKRKGLRDLKMEIHKPLWKDDN